MSQDSLERAATKYSERFGQHNVIAVFPGLSEAREAMQALQRQGIEATHISLLGPAAEEAAADADTTERDGRVIGEVTRATAGGTLAGGAAGGLAGFLTGLAAFAIPGVGPAVGTGVWLSTLGGATLGGGIGGMLGGVSAINAGEAWELSHHVKEGRALVGVHADDPQIVERAASTLAQHRPLELGHFDEHGRKVDPGS